MVLSSNLHVSNPFVGFVWGNLEEEYESPQVIGLILAMPLVACGRVLGEDVFLAKPEK